jgi:hypothetical protein
VTELATFRAKVVGALGALGLEYVSITLGRHIDRTPYWAFAATDEAGRAFGRYVYLPRGVGVYSDEALAAIVEAARSFLRSRP